MSGGRFFSTHTHTWKRYHHRDKTQAPPFVVGTDRKRRYRTHFPPITTEVHIIISLALSLPDGYVIWLLALVNVGGPGMCVAGR